MKHNAMVELTDEYLSEYIRTTGKGGKITYEAGWFTMPNGDKARAKDIKKFIETLKERPTVTRRQEMVNGVLTWIEASQHVVTSLVGGKQVIEERDTPDCCSVASETYWTM